MLPFFIPLESVTLVQAFLLEATPASQEVPSHDYQAISSKSGYVKFKGWIAPPFAAVGRAVLAFG